MPHTDFTSPEVVFVMTFSLTTSAVRKLGLLATGSMLRRYQLPFLPILPWPRLNASELAQLLTISCATVPKQNTTVRASLPAVFHGVRLEVFK